MDQILAVDDLEGGALWGLADQQGTIREVLDDEGELVEQRVFDAFGRLVERRDADGDMLTEPGRVERGHGLLAHMPPR